MPGRYPVNRSLHAGNKADPAVKLPHGTLSGMAQSTTREPVPAAPPALAREVATHCPDRAPRCRQWVILREGAGARVTVAPRDLPTHRSGPRDQLRPAARHENLDRAGTGRGTGRGTCRGAVEGIVEWLEVTT